MILWFTGVFCAGFCCCCLYPQQSGPDHRSTNLDECQRKARAAAHFRTSNILTPSESSFVDSLCVTQVAGLLADLVEKFNTVSERSRVVLNEFGISVRGLPDEWADHVLSTTVTSLLPRDDEGHGASHEGSAKARRADNSRPEPETFSSKRGTRRHTLESESDSEDDSPHGGGNASTASYAKRSRLSSKRSPQASNTAASTRRVSKAARLWQFRAAVFSRMQLLAGTAKCAVSVAHILAVSLPHQSASVSGRIPTAAPAVAIGQELGLVALRIFNFCCRAIVEIATEAGPKEKAALADSLRHHSGPSGPIVGFAVAESLLELSHAISGIPSRFLRRQVLHTCYSNIFSSLSRGGSESGVPLRKQPRRSEPGSDFDSRGDSDATEASPNQLQCCFASVYMHFARALLAADAREAKQCVTHCLLVVCGGLIGL